MSKIIKWILRSAIWKLTSILAFPIRLLFRKRDVIIIQTHSPFRYGGNPKYLFEYLSQHTQYNVYWVTESEEIKNYLKSNNFKYISSSSLINKIYITWSAKVVIDSGSAFYNYFNLLPSDAIKICTMHGSGPKLTAQKKEKLKDTLKYIKEIHKFNYFSFCTKHAAKMVGREQFLLHSNKTALLGAPKSDQFFNHDFVAGRKKSRPLLNELIPQLDKGTKVIYYVPTFRPYDYPFPLRKLEGFDLEDLISFLEQNNLIFLYSFHSIGKLSLLPSKCDRFRFFSFEKTPLIDNNQLLLEVDLLIGDYSTISTDFAILKRPQLFVMPDYNEMDETKGFAEDYRQLIPGPDVTKYSEFKRLIKYFIEEPNKYTDEYGAKVEKLLNLYMNPNLHNSCERFKQFIHRFMK